MPYLNNNNFNKIKKMVLISVLISFALVLSYFERIIPMHFAFPGVKLGLANIITLVSIYFLGFIECFALVTIRVLLGSLFTSSLMTFWYSYTGGILSLVTMYFLMRYYKETISIVGISIIGAVFHNIGQLIVIAIILSDIKVSLTYFPILMISGIITGLLIGYTANYLKPYIIKYLTVSNKIE